MNKFLSVRAVFLVFLVGISVTLSLNLKASLAQETETMSFSYGTVLGMSKYQIVISEYDYDKDEEFEAAYGINRETEFKNVKAATDIVIGDNADIVYVILDDQKVAQSISIEKPSNDEEVDSKDNDAEPVEGSNLPPSAMVTENKI